MLTGAVWEKYFTSRKEIMEIGGERIKSLWSNSDCSPEFKNTDTHFLLGRHCWLTLAHGRYLFKHKVVLKFYSSFILFDNSEVGAGTY